MMLLKPSHFHWAKFVLNSKLWALTPGIIQFQLPDICPSASPMHCSVASVSSVHIEELTDEAMSDCMPTAELPDDPIPDYMPTDELPEDGAFDPMQEDSDSSVPAETQKLRKGKSPLTPLVESQVRRSTRVKEITKGYKNDGCKDRNCIVCAAQPSSISSKIIRNLGVNFCKVPVQYLEDAALSKKPGKKQPVGAGRALGKSKKDKNGHDADPPNKKSKK